MGLITLTTISNGQTGDAVPVNNNFTTLVNEFNGNIDNNNIKPGAAIAISKIAAEAWVAWTPSYGATGSMTYTSVGTTVARYQQISNVVFFQIIANGTTGGSADVGLTFTVPVSRSATTANIMVGSGQVVDSSDKGCYCLWNGTSTTTVFVRKYDAVNFGIGSGREIRINGFYEL